MAIFPASAIPSGASDFTIDQSLRFDDGSDASLSFTPSSAGNRTVWTYSGWIKRGNTTGSTVDSRIPLISAGAGYPDTYEQIWFRSGNSIAGYHGLLEWNSGVDEGDGGNKSAVGRYRDSSAWYHIMVTRSGSTVKLYVNGNELAQEAATDVSATVATEGFNDTNIHRIGASERASKHWDGYMAEVHWIDGTALTPTSFGETGDYGEWKPIKVSGLTYGTNGFYLSFAGGGIMTATGGNSTATDGDYKAASFTADGTFTPSADGFVEYLVIGGGGGGGTNNGAGGGAGGYRTGYLQVTGNTAYSITVGDGGTGNAHTTVANSGEASVFSTITAAGGGGGGGDAAGGNGGSGGGAYQLDFAAGSGNTPSTSPSQGNNGGAGSSGHGSGGGGGAGGVGGTGSTGGNGGDGGAGLSSSITGASVCRAGGGAANGYGSAGSTTCGGGSGAVGTANTGGGGGSKGNVTDAGYTGGSGIVIIRYKFQ
jgi:hypothetical protein